MEEDTIVKPGGPDELYDILVKKIAEYHPYADCSMIRKAYDIAREAHKDQKRRSGEPYIIHPLSVAIILAELKLDKESIAAGILHDTVEDTDITLEDLKKEFSEEIAMLVDGVTKFTRLNYPVDKIELQAANLKKMFLAMAKDTRVILIKLADRLHNMRTLEYQNTAKQYEKAKETLEIYAPIAHRLGISKIKIEMEDLSLKYINPEKYNEISGYRIRRVSDERINGLVEDVKDTVRKAGIKAKVYGRIKHVFGIYKKMKSSDRTFDQIYDLFAVRIIVDTVNDCYAALGAVHAAYKPIQEKIKDYISVPRANNYKSLHTTVIGRDGIPFEIQIRTHDMHRTAEFGVAAHWKYKEDRDGRVVDKEEEKLNWLRQMLEWQRDMSDNREYMDTVKRDLDLFSDEVYCFTPAGDVKNLPKGSTPIDFAYLIHSALGNKMIGAKVNNKIVNINYILQNGERVEILTSNNSKGPSRDWISMVRSAQARNKINQWFKSQFKAENIIRGKELVDKYCKAKNINITELMKPEYIGRILKKYSFRDWDSALAAIGHGDLKEGQIVNRLCEEYEKRTLRKITDGNISDSVPEHQHKRIEVVLRGGIMIDGTDGMALRMSKCCGPVPGDEIIGYVTRGRGVSIHRTDCINIMNLPESDKVRLQEAEWRNGENTSAGEKFLVGINIYAENRTGLLNDISGIFKAKNIDLRTINSCTNKHGTATISMSFFTGGKKELNKIIEDIRKVGSVSDVKRTTG